MDQIGQGAPAPTEGVRGSVRRVLATLLSTLQNRVELLAVELQEERQWLVTMLLWAAAAVFLAGCAITVVTVAIVYLVPAAGRPYALVVLALAYVALAVGAALGLRKRILEKPPAFRETVAELKKDLALLQPPE